MKRHITLVLLIALTSATFAQRGLEYNLSTEDERKASFIQKDKQMLLINSFDLNKTSQAVYQLDSMLYEYFDSGNSMWYKDDMEHLYYDANKQCIIEIDFDFDSMNNRDTSVIAWYTYDTNGNLILEVMGEWNNGQWDTLSKWVYSYSATNKYLGDVQYDYYQGQWFKFWRTDYTYDSNDFLVECLFSDWWGSSWEPIYKEVFVNHSDGRIDQEFEYGWSGTSFYKVDSTYYLYNAGLELIEQTQFDRNNNMWNPDRRYLYTYYASGELESRTRQYYNSTSWDNSTKYEYTYDAQGFLTERLLLDWNNNQWENYYKKEYTYDPNYVYPQITANPYYLDDLAEMLLTEKEFMWDNSGSNWVDEDVETFFWSHTGLHTQERTLTSILMYPNPASDALVIEFDVPKQTFIRLVDITGTTVLQRKFDSTKMNVAISDLSSGLYLLIIERNGETKVEKLVIQ